MAFNLYYSPDYIGAAYEFETTRKAAWVADSLEAEPIPGVNLVEPEPLTREQVATVHDPAYIDAVETGLPGYLAESQGFIWDPGLWHMVLSSNGGVLEAALDALENGRSGSLSSGLHHARRGSGSGFCTFNGLVIAAQEAAKQTAAPILILDLDAHCGGGTASLIRHHESIWQLDVAVDTFDFYDAGSDDDPERIRLHFVNNAPDYLPRIAASLEELSDTGVDFGLCLYNAGMDPFEDCPTGGLPGITYDILAERERMVFDWMSEHRVPTAFVLAGGYLGPSFSSSALVGLHRLTIETAFA